MRSLLILTVAGLVFVPVPSRAVVILDGDFSSFSFDATGTATVAREPSGGSPGARLDITTVSGPLVFGTAIKGDFSTVDPLAGASFSLSLDVLSGPGAFGDGQFVMLLVEQGGSIYGSGILGVTVFPLDFDAVSFGGTFDESAFTLLIGIGPANPEFDGGVAMRFGFAGGNSGSGTLTQSYDNFRLESPAIASVPELPGFETAGLGLIALIAPGLAARSQKGRLTGERIGPDCAERLDHIVRCRG